MYKFSLSFFLLWTALFTGTIANIFLAKENGIANWPIEGKKKQNILHCCVHSEKSGRQIKKAEWCNGNSYIK